MHTKKSTRSHSSTAKKNSHKLHRASKFSITPGIVLIFIIGFLALIPAFFALRLVAAGGPTVSGTVVEQDTCAGRTVANGWGTASDGNVWTLQSGSGSQTSVGGNECSMSGTYSSTLLTLGNASLSEEEGLVRYGTKSFTTDAGRIILRWQNTSNFYNAGFGSISSQPVIDIIKTSGGSGTREWVLNVSPTNGAFYWVRFRVVTSGTSAILSIKYWQDGTAEPTAWIGTWTDTTPFGAGKVGVKGYTAQTTGWSMDNFAIGNLAQVTPTPTPAGPTPTPIPTTIVTPTPTPTSAPTPTSIPTPTPTPGSITTNNVLNVTTQIQSGIGGGFANNQPETDITWTDFNNNGWRVGLIPSYGGATVAPWYEISSGVASGTQVNLATSIPDGFYHFTIDRNWNYLGTESSPYTLTELTPTGTSFRRYYSAQVPSSGTDWNGFSFYMTTAMYPGNPGFLFHRIDVTNPSSSPITLGASDALETDLIGGLQQAGQNVWSPNNGGYGTVGSSPVVGWPSSASINPDYIYITPNSGSNIATGVETVRQTSLTSFGATNLYSEYQLNSSRLKFVVNATLTSFPANTTYTIYTLQVLRRGMTQADAASIAADYRNPDNPAMSVGTFTSFNYNEGLYLMTASNNVVQFTPTISGNVTERWMNIYKVSNYTATNIPTVTLGSTILTPNVDYVAYVDTTNQVAYVKLMKPIVANGANANQFNNGLIQISK